MANSVKSPGTVVNDNSFGTVAWTNENNVKVSDGSYATLVGVANSQYIKTTNFGFAIPTGSPIVGIKVEVERKLSAGTDYDLRARIVKADGTIGTTDKAQVASWPTVEAYETYGGATDLWGETWTAEDINDADFGFALSAQASSGHTLSIDHIRITVYYSEVSVISETITLSETWLSNPMFLFSETITLAETLVQATGRYWKKITKPITTWINRNKN